MIAVHHEAPSQAYEASKSQYLRGSLQFEVEENLCPHRSLTAGPEPHLSVFKPQCPAFIHALPLSAEGTVRLKFEPFDGRSPNYRPIIDADTNKQVGSIHSHTTGTDCFGGIDISLFNGKYRARVNRYEAAVGFVFGVETILNHMTSSQGRKSA
jgi:hypothetical protein